jgi:hypothetical protein
LGFVGYEVFKRFVYALGGLPKEALLVHEPILIPGKVRCVQPNHLESAFSE